jgi:IS5 family transposase
MKPIKKDKQWNFGMKMHIDVDAEAGLVHKIIGAAVNVMA